MNGLADFVSGKNPFGAPLTKDDFARGLRRMCEREGFSIPEWAQEGEEAMDGIKAGSSPDPAATYVYISLADLVALRQSAADFERDWETARLEAMALRQQTKDFDELLRLAAAWGRFAATYYERSGSGGLLVHYDADLLRGALKLQRACRLPVNPVSEVTE